MSSIYLRNGIWQIQFKRDGKTFQQSLKTRSKKEAEDSQRVIDAGLEREESVRTEHRGIGTVGELVDAYLVHAEQYYRKNGELTSQYHLIGLALRGLKPYRQLPTNEFGPVALRTVREKWINHDLSRSTVNRYTGIVKALFKWGVSHEYCSPLVHHALSTVEGLRVGRTRAKESQPVKPVLEGHIEAVRAVLPPTVRGMVDLQLACGARSGEILELRPCDIDRSGTVWTANLAGKHKTAHHGKERILYFGPRAQQVLRPFIERRDPWSYLFSPREAIKERHADCETHRRPNQKPNERQTDRVVGDHFDTASYRRAIMLQPGARVFACIPKSGYVGVGTVIEPAVPIRDFRARALYLIMPTLVYWEDETYFQRST